MRKHVPEVGEGKILLHSEMYTIADKYDVPGLKELAREKFSLASEYCWQKIEFIIAAEHAYTTTMDDDDGLRAIVRDTLAAKKEILSRADVQTFLEE